LFVQGAEANTKTRLFIFNAGLYFKRTTRKKHGLTFIQ